MNLNRTNIVLAAALLIVVISSLFIQTDHSRPNLQIYLGPEPLNAYAKFLKSTPLVLWGARFGLLAIFGLHLLLAVNLKRQNRRARPQNYVVNDPVETTLASRTMMSSGIVILAFVIYHLAHFTLGVTNPALHELVDSAGRHDVYSMVVLSFQNPYVSATYIFAMLLLGLHLSHAAASIWQTFGITSSRSRTWIHNLGWGIAAILTLGNISIPISILLGLVGLPEEVTAP